MYRDEQYTMLRKDQGNALRQFAEQDGIPAEHVETLAQITGRGYRPPTDAAGWRAFYDSIKAWAFEAAQ